jgi:hypothetical protein
VRNNLSAITIMAAPTYTFSSVNTAFDSRYFAVNNDGTVIILAERTSTGTIKRSTDSGVTLSSIVLPGITRPLNRTNKNPTACSSNGQIMYVLSIDGDISTSSEPGNYFRLFKSTDSGVTFTMIMNGLPNNVSAARVLCNSAGTTVLLYSDASSLKLYYSTNSGSSFSESTLAAAASTLAVIPQNIMTINSDGSIMYTLLGSNDGSNNYYSIYKSTDSGANFSEIYTDYNNPGNVVDLNLLNNLVCNSTGSILYAESQESSNRKLYKSTNSGTEWSDVSVPGITSGGFDTISCDSTGDIIIIGLDDNVTGEKKIYVSENGGSTWGLQLITGSPTLGSAFAYVSANGEKFYISDVDADILYSYPTSAPPPPPVPCFTGDAKILCKIEGVETYVAIKDLSRGILVKTSRNGFQPIEMVGMREISHPASEERIGEQLYVCTKEKYPELTEDLVITGGHAILVTDFKDDDQKKKVIDVYGKVFVTDRKYRLPACVDDRTEVYTVPGKYMVYHIYIQSDLKNNYGIYANGLLVESGFKKFMMNTMTIL